MDINEIQSNLPLLNEKLYDVLGQFIGIDESDLNLQRHQRLALFSKALLECREGKASKDSLSQLNFPKSNFETLYEKVRTDIEFEKITVFFSRIQDVKLLFFRNVLNNADINILLRRNIRLVFKTIALALGFTVRKSGKDFCEFNLPGSLSIEGYIFTDFSSMRPTLRVNNFFHFKLNDDTFVHLDFSLLDFIYEFYKVGSFRNNHTLEEKRLIETYNFINLLNGVIIFESYISSSSK